MSPRAAVLSWLLVVVALLLTVNPVVVAAATLAGATLAWRNHLVAVLRVGLVSGAVLALLSPLLASYGTQVLVSVLGHDVTLEAVRTGGVLGMRLAGIVFAVALLSRLTADDLYFGVGRLSHRTALVAALAARSGPMLARDAAVAREELTSVGVHFEGVPLTRRLAARSAQWRCLVAGMFDRAFATASALSVRGYGAGRPTPGRLAPGPSSATSNIRDGLAITAALAGCVLIVAASLTGIVVAGLTTSLTSASIVAAMLVCVPFVVALRADKVDVADTPGRMRAPTEPPLARDLGLARTATGSAVRLAGVSVAYPTGPAVVQSIDLEVEHGEILVLAGASGSGKSSLLAAINGLMPFATGGRVRGSIDLVGKYVAGAPPSARGHIVASVFQDPEQQVLTGLVAEEVAFGARQLGLPLADVRDRVQRALADLELTHLVSRRTDELSGGELQQVMLAAALALDPQVLLLDEPTSQLDHAGAERFWAVLRRAHARRGMAIISTEHHPGPATDTANRVAYMADGRIAWVRALDRDTQRASIVAAAFPGYELGRRPHAGPANGAARLQLSAFTVPLRGAQGTSVVRSLDVAFTPGSVVALEGPNGCGKSTLLRAIRGLGERRGSVFVDGRPLDDVASSAWAFGYVSQHAGPRMAGSIVLEHAVQVLAALGGAARHAHGQAALVWAGLDAVGERHPMDLSVGQRERLAVVAATLHEPPVVLLDEPTRGMDPTARDWLAWHVAGLAARGAVVIVATHDAGFAAAVATHRWTFSASRHAAIVPVDRDQLVAVMGPSIDAGVRQ